MSFYNIICFTKKKESIMTWQNANMLRLKKKNHVERILIYQNELPCITSRDHEFIKFTVFFYFLFLHTTNLYVNYFQRHRAFHAKLLAIAEKFVIVSKFLFALEAIANVMRVKH